MIDEYQDTNRSQYELMRLLTEAHDNVCVVGDEDQSIYSWRGADIRNILDFETRLSRTRRPSAWSRITARRRTFWQPPARWWRTTRSARARGSGPKPGEGDMLGLYAGYDAENEALFIADTIEKHPRVRIPTDRVAVLYRTNSQSRQIEEALRRYGRKYNVVGGIQFLPARRNQGHRRVSEARRSRTADSVSLHAHHQYARARHRPHHGGAGGEVRARARPRACGTRSSACSTRSSFGTRRTSRHGGVPQHDPGDFAGGDARRRCPRRSRSSGAHRLPARCWSRKTRRNREARIENLNELMNAAAEARSAAKRVARFSGPRGAGRRRRRRRRSARRSR